MAAVDATRGQIVVYDGKVIRAFFHSNAGGYTESSENVWVEPLPYLKAVPSPYDIYAAQYENQTNGWPSVSYSWQKGITREELYSQVSRWNKKAENNDSLNLINVGSISDIKLSRIDRNGDKDTASGRVTELTLIGDQGQASVYRDGIRTLLGLRSTLFNISFDSTVTVLNGRGDQGRINSLDGSYSAGYDGRTTLVNKGEKDVFLQSRSANRQIPKKFSKVVIEGNGYGHGLGMSQWGARGMAKDGYKYDKIIQHYYNQGLDNGNLSIETIY